MIRIALYLCRKHVAAVDALVNLGIFKNRGEAVRKAIEMLMTGQAAAAGQPCSGGKVVKSAYVTDEQHRYLSRLSSASAAVDAALSTLLQRYAELLRGEDEAVGMEILPGRPATHRERREEASVREVLEALGGGCLGEDTLAAMLGVPQEAIRSLQRELKEAGVSAMSRGHRVVYCAKSDTTPVVVYL